MIEAKLKRRSFLKGMAALVTAGVIPEIPLAKVKHFARDTGKMPPGMIYTIQIDDKIGHLISTDNGWVPCDGRTLRKDKYPKLFSVLHEEYKRGNPHDKFSIPDLRGMFVRGRDSIGQASAGLLFPP